MECRISEIDVEDFIQHFGVKGMKWGVRGLSTNAAVTMKVLKRIGSTKVSDIPSMRYSHGFEITKMVQNILDLTS